MTPDPDNIMQSTAKQNQKKNRINKYLPRKLKNLILNKLIFQIADKTIVSLRGGGNYINATFINVIT